MNNYDLNKERLFAQNMNVGFKDSFGRSLLIWWISITLIYTVLYYLFLDNTFEPSIGGHIAGFVGLFAPVGLLSLVASILPNYLFGNIVALGIIGLAIFVGSKIRILGIKKIILILIILFTITYIADLIRTLGGFFGEGFTSWEIMLNGRLPQKSL